MQTWAGPNDHCVEWEVCSKPHNPSTLIIPIRACYYFVVTWNNNVLLKSSSFTNES